MTMPRLPGPKSTSRIGFGTWRMGGLRSADSVHDAEETRAIGFALDHGINVLDTAEMYGAGHAEELVARALAGRDRESIYVITKVLPEHLDRDAVARSARASLRRMGLTYADLYLIHWPPERTEMIREGIRAMEDLVREGLVRAIGVSNFGVREMEEAMAAASRTEISANQVKYSLRHREPEREVIPFCEDHHIAVIAHTPLDRGGVADLPAVREVAGRTGHTPVQVALNYLVPRTVPIPKATRIDHLEELLGSLGWELSAADRERLRSEGPPAR